jgi:hypothetical protein
MVELASRLATVRETLGIRVYRIACQRALLAIGVAVHIEAERRARKRRRLARPPLSEAVVVRFPLARARENEDNSSGREP